METQNTQTESDRSAPTPTPTPIPIPIPATETAASSRDISSLSIAFNKEDAPRRTEGDIDVWNLEASFADVDDKHEPPPNQTLTTSQEPNTPLPAFPEPQPEPSQHPDFRSRANPDSDSDLGPKPTQQPRTEPVLEDFDEWPNQPPNSSPPPPPAPPGIGRIAIPAASASASASLPSDMDPVLKQRKILLADSDLFIAVDYSNTLAEDWISGLVSIWLTKYYFRRLGGFVMVCMIITVSCIFANIIQPERISEFLFLSTFGISVTYPVFIIFVLQSTIARMTLRHFESMFLLFNAVVSVLCLGDIVGWSITMRLGSIIYITSYFCIIFMDSWQLSFSVYDRLFGELNASIDAESFRIFQERPDRRISIVQPLANPNDMPSTDRRRSSISSLIQGRSSSRRDSHRTSTLPLEMVASPKNTIRKCKEFYAKLTFFHQGIYNITTFLKPFRYMAILVGLNQILVILFGISIPIISQLLLPVNSAKIENITTFRVLKSVISTKSIFRACAVNVMMFCFRRLLMNFLFPLKVYGMSRKITRIVLVEGWYYFVSEEFYHQRRRLLQHNNNSISYTEPTVQIQHNRRLSRRSTNGNKFEIVINDSGSTVCAIPERRESVQLLGQISEDRNTDNSEIFSSANFSPSNSFLSSEIIAEKQQEYEENTINLPNSPPESSALMMTKPPESEREGIETISISKSEASGTRESAYERKESKQMSKYLEERQSFHQGTGASSSFNPSTSISTKSPPDVTSTKVSKGSSLANLLKHKDIIKEEDEASSSSAPNTSLSASARIGVIFTPDRQTHFYDMNDSIYNNFLSEEQSHYVLHLCRLVNKIEVWIIFPIWIFICFELNMEMSHIKVVSSCVYTISVFFSLVHISTFNRSGMYRVLVGFETAFALVSSLMIHIFLIDFTCHGGREYRVLMALLSFLITFRVICIDAQPVSFANFHKNLEVLHHQIENGEDFDMDVFVVVMKLSHLIRSKIDKQIDRRQGWGKNEGNDLFEESNTTDTFWKRTKRRWTLVLFFSNGALVKLFFNIFHVLCIWVMIDGDLILSPFDREYHTFVGMINTKGLIRASLFNLGVIYVRRLWSHFCDPTRSVCIERRIVKIPLVPSLFPEQQVQPLPV